MEKKLTRKEWVKLESKEMEKMIKIEEVCEKIANSKPVKEKLDMVRNLFG